VTSFQPTGSQPTAIQQLVDGITDHHRFQTLLGVTGSGKTFTMANVINEVQRPTLVIAHNKTLASQLYQEFCEFFPDNRVEYFVSYYDYYQPESYLPHRDQYIEKDADVNPKIEQMRLSATGCLLPPRLPAVGTSSSWHPSPASTASATLRTTAAWALTSPLVHRLPAGSSSSGSSP